MANFHSALAQTSGKYSDADIQAVESHVIRSMESLGTPGVAVALIDNGEIVYMGTFGVIDIAGTSPVTRQTPFQIGSLSKSFTARAILQLAAEDKIDLVAPIASYLPTFRTRNKIQSDLITVNQVLSHTSGISTLDGNRHQMTQYNADDALSFALSKLETVDLKYAPGSTFEYSNANFVVAAALLEEIERARFEVILKERVLQPLGMENSYVRQRPLQSAPPAIGHARLWGSTKPTPHIMSRMNIGGGGVTASIEDMGRYMLSVIGSDRFRAGNSKLASDSPSAIYSYGWFVERELDPILVSHGGLNPGFSAAAAFEPETGKGFVLLTNQSGTLKGEIRNGVEDIMRGFSPRPATPSRFAYASAVFAVILPAFLLIGALLSIKRINKMRSRDPQERSPVWKIGLLITILTGLIWACLFAIPQSFGATFRSAFMFQPDVIGGLGVSALICFAWIIARLIFAVRQRTRKT
nr:serine hydrolase domain-containing protein [Erythrobacter crassostrea]